MTFKDIDKIYFLHLSDRYDREEWMMNQIKQIGFPKNKLNIWWTCRRPITNEISKYIPDLHNGQYQAYVNTSNPSIGGSTFNCTFEHYSIIRTSYERGFEHILIFEDDVKFLVNLKTFKKFIKLLPSNYQVCKFINVVWENDIITEKSTYYNTIPQENQKITNPYQFIYGSTELDYASTCGYMLDREGMRKVIEIYNKRFCIADHIFQYLNFYVCNYQLMSTQDWNCPPNEYLWSDLWKLNTSQRFNQFK